MHRYGSVYLITDLSNNKKYVGITTTTVSARWSSHCAPSSSCTYLHNAIHKRGKENFLVEEIYVSFDKEHLKDSELSFIKQFNTLAPTGYNLTEGRGFEGKQSAITCLKKSTSHKKSWEILNQDKDYKASRTRGIKAYVDNKKVRIISVCMSTGTVTRYDSITSAGYKDTGDISYAIRKGSYRQNHYWFKDLGQSDIEVQDIVLSKLGGRWQPENSKTVVAKNLSTGELIEFSNIFKIKDRFKDVDTGWVRKILDGKLKAARGWTFFSP